MNKLNFLRAKINFYLNESKDKRGKIINNFIYALILLSVLDFSLQTIPNYNRFHPSLAKFEFVVLVIFTIEYILRVFSSKNPLKFIVSFYGIIDLITILPSFFGLAYDIRSLRVLRLLRIFGNYSAFNSDIFNKNKFLKDLKSLDKKNPFCVYCQSGKRSRMASKILADLGFERVYDLKGGYANWVL